LNGRARGRGDEVNIVVGVEGEWKVVRSEADIEEIVGERADNAKGGRRCH
jgi:hypothetical protein